MSDRVIALAGSDEYLKNKVLFELLGTKSAEKERRFYYKFNNYNVINLPENLNNASDILKENDISCIVCVINSACLESSLLYAFKLLDLSKNVILYLSFEKEYETDEKKLSDILNLPVLKEAARSGKGINALLEKIHLITTGAEKINPNIIANVKEILDFVKINNTKKSFKKKGLFGFVLLLAVLVLFFVFLRFSF